MISWDKVLLLFMCFSLMGWVCLIYGLFRDRWFRRKLERETEEAQARIVRYTVKAVSSGDLIGRFALESAKIAGHGIAAGQISCQLTHLPSSSFTLSGYRRKILGPF